MVNMGSGSETTKKMFSLRAFDFFSLAVVGGLRMARLQYY